VVIVYRKSPEAGHYSYGHAAGNTVAEAQERAISELARTNYVLTLRREKGITDTPKYFFERRCVFFSAEEGHELFQARVRSKETKPTLPWTPPSMARSRALGANIRRFGESPIGCQALDIWMTVSIVSFLVSWV